MFRFREPQNCVPAVCRRCDYVGVIGPWPPVLTKASVILCWKAVDCSLQMGADFLLQVKEFKHLTVVVLERWEDGAGNGTRWIGAVTLLLYWTVVVNKELSLKAKLLICQSTLTYNQQLLLSPLFSLLLLPSSVLPPPVSQLLLSCLTLGQLDGVLSD